MAKYEEKFIVINNKHLSQKYIPEDVLESFNSAWEDLFPYLPMNDYYVCNQDEPYAPKVIETILNGEDEKQSPNVSKDEAHPIDGHVKQAVSSGDENGGSKFDATELWNRAINFISPIETNGYWKALRDLHEKGVIELRELDIE